MAERFFKLPVDLAARDDLTPADKIIYAVLADHARGNGTAWPGMRRLADETALGRKTVWCCIRRLAERTDLRVIQGANGQTNRYDFGGKSGVKMTPVGKSKRGQNDTGGCVKMTPEAGAKRLHKQTDPLKQRGGAASRRATPSKSGKAKRGKPVKHGPEVHRLFAKVCEAHKARFDDNPDERIGGTWRGLLDALLDEPYAEGRIAEAVGRFFQKHRKTHGPAMFDACFRARDTALWGPARGKAAVGDPVAAAAAAADDPVPLEAAP